MRLTTFIHGSLVWRPARLKASGSRVRIGWGILVNCLNNKKRGGEKKSFTFPLSDHSLSVDKSMGQYVTHGQGDTAKSIFSNSSRGENMEIYARHRKTLVGMEVLAGLTPRTSSGSPS
jgi:hypothetical protein